MCSSHWAHFQSSVLLVQLNEHSFWLIFGIACKGYWPPPPILPHLKDSLPPYLTALPVQNNPHFPVLPYPILTFENNEFIVFLKNSSFAIQLCSPPSTPPPTNTLCVNPWFLKPFQVFGFQLTELSQIWPIECVT